LAEPRADALWTDVFADVGTDVRTDGSAYATSSRAHRWSNIEAKSGPHVYAHTVSNAVAFTRTNGSYANANAGTYGDAHASDIEFTHTVTDCRASAFAVIHANGITDHIPFVFSNDGPDRKA
jgi:hypothetical protein